MTLPPDFSSRPLAIKYLDPSELIRIGKRAPASPPTGIYYGKRSSNRFDCPKGLFGVMYAAFDLSTCFAETITRESNRGPMSCGGIAVSHTAEIQNRFVVTLQAGVPLKLANATDVGLYGLGAEAGEFNSVSYAATTQQWAEAIFNRPEQVDGIYYRSRFLNGRGAVAIFERGGQNAGLFAGSVVDLQAHPQYLNTLAELKISLMP